MPNSVSYDAIAAAGGTVSLMNRLTTDAGETILSADVSVIRCSIYSVGSGGTLEAVTGHDAQDLDPADVVYDTLQADPPWDADTVGYNFRHTPDATDNDPFPAWGTTYLVVYEVTLIAGPPIVWRWVVRTAPTVA